MHLLCQDRECVGNDLPAGLVGAASCRYCGKALADGAGNVLAQGATPVIDGSPARSVDQLMDALRDAGYEVCVVDLSAVRVEDKLLVSALGTDGELLSASVLDGDGPEAGAVEHMMELMDGGA